MTLGELRKNYVKVYAALQMIIASNCQEGGFQNYPSCKDSKELPDALAIENMDGDIRDLDLSVIPEWFDEGYLSAEWFDEGYLSAEWKQLVLSVLED